jgi:5'-methylthioadenosine phosphorylase
LLANADKARALIQEAIPRLSGTRSFCPCGCDRALDSAVITAAHMRDPALVAKLESVAGRVLRG